MSFLLSLVAGYLSWKLVEKPTLKLKKQTIRLGTTPAIISGAPQSERNHIF